MTEAHAHLLRSAARGEVASFANLAEDERVIEASFIRELLLGNDVGAAASGLGANDATISPHAVEGRAGAFGPRALRIHRAHVRGRLDLSWCGCAHSPLPLLSFNRCTFERGDRASPSIDLSHAHIGGLELVRSKLTHLRGVDMRVAGSVDLESIGPLDDDDDARCWCKLSRAVIDGHLLVDGVHLNAPPSVLSDKRYEMDSALNLYMSRIAGSVMLGTDPRGEGPSVEGGILLDSACVEGDVWINQARILPYSCGKVRFAVALERARIRGSLTLAGAPDTKLTCGGRIWMYLAEIEGSFDMYGATLTGDSTDSLYARGVAVRGGVLLTDVEAAGRVDLRGMRVERDLTLKRNRFAGEVDLTDAQCATLDVDLSDSAAASRIANDGLRYQRVESDWFREGDGFRRWLRRGDYTPQPYMQLALALGREGEEFRARKVLAAKAWCDAERDWYRVYDERGKVKTKLGVLDYLKLAINRSVYAVVALYGFLFEFGLSPVRALGTLLGAIALGWAMFGWINHRGAMVVAQTPVAGFVLNSKFVAASADASSPGDIWCNGDGNPTIRLPVYAADVFIPLVDLREEGKCDIEKATGHSPSGAEVTAYKSFKALYAIAGWVVTTLALLTFSGVTRHRMFED